MASINERDLTFRATERLRAAESLLRRRGRVGAAPASLVMAVEAGLVVLIGLLAGKMVLALLTPPPAYEPPTRTTIAVETPGEAPNPFRTAKAAPVTIVETAVEEAETSLDLKLHGTWVDDAQASAIISLPGGEQRTFFLGDAVCCNAELVEIYPDRVIISRAGVRESLRLSDRQPARRSPGRPARPTTAQESAQPAGLSAILTISPRVQPSGETGMELFPRDGAEARFETLGLRPGDILVSVNGRAAPAAPAEAMSFLASLEGAATAEVVVNRGGALTPLQIALDPASMAPDR